jgi:hypothetical protein
MKYYLLILIMLVTSCTSATQFGPCVGINEDKNPKLVYKYSMWNAFWGLFGFELLFIPTLDVVLNKLECPVGVK